MEIASPIHSPSTESIETRSAHIAQALMKINNGLKPHDAVIDQLDAKLQMLLSQRDKFDEIQTYRTALQEHEEQEQRINWSSTQLKERMRVETEWYKENVFGQWSHPMGIAPPRKIMTRSVRRSQPQAQSKEEQGMWHRSTDRDQR